MCGDEFMCIFITGKPMTLSNSIQGAIARLAPCRFVPGAILAAALCIAAAPVPAGELRGAGATFPAPLYKAWIDRFHRDNPETTIRYDVVGSGEGLARFGAGEVDFAGSDAAMPILGSERFESAGAQFPITAGMIVVAYNLPGVTGQLKLSRKVYDDIFLGRIRRWDDPAIAAVNPGMRLPALGITVVARADSSGTTFAFTSHLAAVSPYWADSGPGVGKKVSWPGVVALAAGNEGVASRLAQSAGSMGYVEYGLARRLGLAVAALENKSGNFVAPSLDTGEDAVKQSTYVGLESLKSSILDPAGAGAYPIVSYSWLILHWDYPAEQWRAIRKFVDYALGEGQTVAPELGYIRLPPPVVYRGRAVAERVFLRADGETALSDLRPGPDTPTGKHGASSSQPTPPVPAADASFGGVGR
jgi:phosphate transport system substrate-binding protein